MAKQFTQSELESIRKTVYATCSSKGIAPMIDSPFGKIVNPAHSACVQTEYDNAIKAGTQGKLGLWFDKANSFIQAKGGLFGILQNFGNLSQAYQTGLAQGQAGNIGQQGDINQFEADTRDQGYKKDSGNIGIWIGIIAMLLVVIVLSIWYFNKTSKK
jgi:hypothetical protein